MGVGDLLSELRLDNKLKQKDVAKFLNVSIATISHYESGVNMPDLETLVKLANFYGVSVDYLLGRIRIVYKNTPVRRAGYHNGGRNDEIYKAV